METYLNSPIKELIDRFPDVGKILDRYGVGCVTCNVGTCLLKDIIKNPPPPRGRRASSHEQHRGGHPPGHGGHSTQPRAPGSARGHPGGHHNRRGRSQAAFRYSPPLKQLVDEHLLIKRWLALVPAFVDKLDLESAEDRRLVLDAVDFIRSYADGFHHAKEEDILFKYFDEDQAILKAMLADHERARGHARAVEEGVAGRDKERVAHHLSAYRDLLSEHIKKEDEILYPWMDRGLTTTQIGELFARFARVDDQIGAELSNRPIHFVERVEKFVTTEGSEAQ